MNIKGYTFNNTVIYNGDCFDVMKQFDTGVVDIILTSPPYNTNKHAGKNTVIKDLNDKNGITSNIRYDMYIDNMTNDEYCDFTRKLFIEFDRILKSNGCILYNLSYGGENSECMFRAVNEIIIKTPFTIADTILWKKQNAFPNSTSSNKLTRTCEFIFVFCRKSEYHTFHCNKRITSYRDTGQACYENIQSLIEAKNNDEVCPYNKATYSSDLCTKLLKIYAPKGALVYDPFMGSGTTAVACEKMELISWGSEISKNQCEWAINRLKRQDTMLEFDFSSCE